MEHRLHDFVVAGEKIFAAAGFPPEKFREQLDKVRKSAGAEIAAGDSFVVAMQTVLRNLARGAVPGEILPGYKAWFPSGVTAVCSAQGDYIVGIRPQTLVELIHRAPRNPFDSTDWLPRNAREAGGAFLRTSTIFADVGVKVSKREPSSGNAYWEFVFQPSLLAIEQ